MEILVTGTKIPTPAIMATRVSLDKEVILGTRTRLVTKVIKEVETKGHLLSSLGTNRMTVLALRLEEWDSRPLPRLVAISVVERTTMRRIAGRS